ncbi:MAG TPA: STAS domain-containing protein [Thermoleophilaceae bacterium]
MSAFPELQVERHDLVPVVTLSGDVDITIASELRTALLGAVDNSDPGLVVDLSGVRYLDSAGVNLLFELADSLGVRRLAFALVLPGGGLVERVITLVDLGSVARIERTMEEAVAFVEAGGAPEA